MTATLLDLIMSLRQEYLWFELILTQIHKDMYGNFKGIYRKPEKTRSNVSGGEKDLKFKKKVAVHNKTTTLLNHPITEF